MMGEKPVTVPSLPGEDRPLLQPRHAQRKHPSRGPRPTLAGLGVVAWAALAPTGCTPPKYEGPQIQEPPAGFFLNPDATKSRELFPDREPIHRDTWVNGQWGQVSTIHITGYPGTLMRADAGEALEESRAAATEPVTFGNLQEVSIDGRTAWGWEERLETPTTGLEWVAYRVVVPYDTISYAVELFSGDPAIKGVPDTLAAIAATFAVGETTWNIPLLVAIAILIFVLIRAARIRARAEKERLQNVHFVKVPEKEPKGGGGEDGGSGPETTDGGGYRPGSQTEGGSQAPGPSDPKAPPP
jgi:hypothetical protein